MTNTTLPVSELKLGDNSRLDAGQNLAELMASIKQHGILEPIGVAKNGTGWDVLYGNRRYMAAKKLGLTEVPVVVHPKTTSSEKRTVLNLVENLQRKDLSPTEYGRYFLQLRKLGYSVAEIAAKVSLAKSFVDDCIQAFQFVPEKHQSRVVSVKPGARRVKGRIPLNTVRKIRTVQADLDLGRQEVEALFDAAAEDEDFSPINVPNYVAAIRAGKKNFVKGSNTTKVVMAKFKVSKKEVKWIDENYIRTGEYSSLNSFVIATLNGTSKYKFKTAKGFSL